VRPNKVVIHARARCDANGERVGGVRSRVVIRGVVLVVLVLIVVVRARSRSNGDARRVGDARRSC